MFYNESKYKVGSRITDENHGHCLRFTDCKKKLCVCVLKKQLYPRKITVFLAIAFYEIKSLY